MSNKTIERIFQIAAAVLILAAAYFWWNGDHERVFVFAAIGSLSFFIGFRFQVKQRLKERQDARDSELQSETEAAVEAIEAVEPDVE